MSADQRDNLVLRVIATVRPEIEDLTADLLRSTSERQRNSLGHVANMDEGTGVSALINNQFALRYRFENELIHDQVEPGAGRDPEQRRESKDQRGAG